MAQNLKGKLLGKYGIRVALVTLFTFTALLFVGVGAFLLWGVIPNIGKTIMLSGDISLVYNTAYAALGIGVIVFVAGIISIKPDTKFYLYENAIRAVNKHGDRTDYYKDIEDLFVFPSNRGFGYRASAQGSWVFCGRNTSDCKALTRKLRKNLIKHQSDKLINNLKTGQKVIFRRISDGDAVIKNLFATPNLEYQTFEIILTENDLTIDGKTIAIEEISQFNTNDWFEIAEILDMDKNVFVQIPIAAIFSFDVLFDLVHRLKSK